MAIALCRSPAPIWARACASRTSTFDGNLAARLGRGRRGVFPVLAHQVKVDELDPRGGVLGRRGAGALDLVDRFRPFLFRDRDIGEAEQPGDVVRLLRQQIVVDFSRIGGATGRQIKRPEHRAERRVFRDRLSIGWSAPLRLCRNVRCGCRRGPAPPSARRRSAAPPALFRAAPWRRPSARHSRKPGSPRSDRRYCSGHPWHRDLLWKPRRRRRRAGPSPARGRPSARCSWGRGRSRR